MSVKTTRLLDEYLVVTAQAGGRKALEQLARRWHPKLVAHAWRLTGDPETARDAVQTGWGNIIRGLNGLREPRAFPAWAYRIVSRACAGEIGGRVQQRELKQAIAAEPVETTTEQAEPLNKARLQAAIQQLPAGERAAIALYHFEELRVAEVAISYRFVLPSVKSVATT